MNGRTRRAHELCMRDGELVAAATAAAACLMNAKFDAATVLPAKSFFVNLFGTRALPFITIHHCPTFIFTVGYTIRTVLLFLHDISSLHLTIRGFFSRQLCV